MDHDSISDKYFVDSQDPYTKSNEEQAKVLSTYIAMAVLTIQNAEKELAEITDRKKEIEEILNKDKEIKCEIQNNISEYKKVLKKDKEVCESLNAIRWFFLVVAVFSFMVVPVLLLILIFFIDQNKAVDIFQSIASSFIPYIVTICGIIASTGLANIYRILRDIKKDIDKIKENT